MKELLICVATCVSLTLPAFPRRICISYLQLVSPATVAASAPITRRAQCGEDHRLDAIREKRNNHSVN